MSKLIGRKYETDLLQESFHNSSSELIAIYGRRRVGKTFLIREFYKKHLVFEISGLYNGNMNDQIKNFTNEIHKKTGRSNHTYLQIGSTPLHSSKPI
ncbi:ATP-binding protein [Niabella defluvii]|nr:ATP-binding protein [Niabella sp. I65]